MTALYDCRAWLSWSGTRPMERLNEVAAWPVQPARSCGERSALVLADSPLEKMPLYVRAGSIVPMTEPMQYVDEIPEAPYEIRVYTGADADFTLYEDAGDSYDYERGAFSLIRLSWSERGQELAISAREGSFPSMLGERAFRVVFISESAQAIAQVRYGGEAILLQPAQGKGNKQA